MNPERWQRLQEICFAVLELPEPEREAHLARTCGDDHELHREAERLLHHYDSAPDFLETPLIAREHVEAGSPPDEDSTFIGPYRVIRPLGEGGMGAVYLAVHEEPDFRQSVAVKVIRPGMDSGEILQRFRLERQILASLHHPHVARILDAGSTDDGRPYFVMEYIEGQPIDVFCDERDLPLADRLTLFSQICDAVQHAHQNLVVHRDLKPSNVLVNRDGVPKLLDFGIGKVLAPSADLSGPLTRTDMRMFTPEYAAPEQIRGDPVTTATDVYSLGVVLYRLLTGRHPYLEGAESLAEMERAVCDTEPPRPSAVVTGGGGAGSPRRRQRDLEGDLDTIALKALRKEPERRYPSAAALANDLERHRGGLPITARADTLTYRFGKFVRRHAVAVTAAAAVVISLLATVVVSVVQAARVSAERDNALQERDKAVEVRGFLMEMFGATGADEAADTLTARQLLDLQAATVDQTYADRPELKAEMMEVLADGYDRLGLYAEAEPLARAALELRRRVLPADHPDLAASLNLVGWITHERGGSEEAIPLLEEAIAIRRAGGDTRRRDLSRSLNDLGAVLTVLGHYDSAGTVLAEALASRLELFGEGHRAVGITANNLAAARFYLGDYPAAAEAAEQAVTSLGIALGPDHARTILAERNLAIMRETAGDLEGAEQTYQDLLDRQVRVQGRRHPMTAWMLSSLANVKSEQGNPEDARPLLLEAVSIDEEFLGLDNPQRSERLHALAMVEARLKNYDGAFAAIEEAMALQRGASDEVHPDIALMLESRAGFERAVGDRDAARATLQRAVGVLDGTLGPTHPASLRIRNTLGDLLLETGDHGPALRVFAQARDHLRADSAAQFEHTDWDQTLQMGVVRSLLAAGDSSAASDELAELRALARDGRLEESLSARLDSLSQILSRNN